MERSAQNNGRRIVNLLTALVALTGALAVGLAVVLFLLWRDYRDLRHAVAFAAGEQGMSAREVVEEVSRRQEAFSAQLAAEGKETARQVAEFERRAADIRKQGGGPIDSAQKAVDIAQLMMDQSLLALKQTATLHEVLQKSSRPLAAQRELIEAEGDAATPRSARRPARSSSSRPASDTPARTE